MPAKHYFVVMQECGHYGLEAKVHPENTRRQMIDRIVTGEDKIDSIAWVHEVRDYGDGEGLIATDITEEVKAEALSMIVTEPEDIDRQAQAWDRKRDLEKHELV